MAGCLDGIRVLELGQLIAGPYCGQILGDFGAEVVKLEQPGTGDPMRSWGVVVDGRSLSWAVIARNKRSIAADLRSEQGRALALALAEQADVLVENFRPGTLERLGLGWDELHERNPRLVLVRISGFGQDGPYAGRAGFGSIGEAMGGLRHLTGDPDRPPSRVGVSLGDMLAGMNGALGALMALHARTATGLGQVVDVSLVESVLGITEALVAE
jgi:crotonobetainyl-CoA:carnitine CoA-transferase CaiB-like acyl-CoA transferase